MVRIRYILLIILIVILSVANSQNNECFDYNIEQCLIYKNNTIVFSSNKCVNKTNSTERTTNIRISFFDSSFVKKWEIYLDSSKKSTLQNGIIINDCLIIVTNEEYIVDYLGSIRSNYNGKLYKVNLDSGKIVQSRNVNYCIVGSQLIHGEIAIFGNEIIRNPHQHENTENTQGFLMQFNSDLELKKKQTFLNNFSYTAEAKWAKIFNYSDENKMAILGLRLKGENRSFNNVCFTNPDKKEFVFAIDYLKYDETKKEYVSDSLIGLDCKDISCGIYRQNIIKNKIYYAHCLQNSSLKNVYEFDIETRKIKPTEIITNELIILKNGSFVAYESKSKMIRVFSNKYKLKKKYNINTLNLNTYKNDWCFFEFNKNLIIAYLKNNEIKFTKIF